VEISLSRRKHRWGGPKRVSNHERNSSIDLDADRTLMGDEKLIQKEKLVLGKDASPP